MADLEFLDSFGHYDTNTMYQKYNNPTGSITAGDGRFGANAYNPGATRTRITFKRNLTEVYCGMAMKINSGADLAQSFFDLVDGLGFGAGKIYSDSAGRLYAQTADTTIGGGTFSIFHEVWYYIEAKFLLANPGEVTFFLNEVQVAQSLGDNRPRAFNLALSGYVYATSLTLPSPNMKCSDFYIHTTANLGDIKVRYIKPNAAGSNSAWTSSGANQWSVLDEIPPNGDTDYLSTDTLNAISSVNMEDVVLDGTCEGIQILCSMKKDEANIRSAKTVIVEGGTTTLGTEESLPSEYHYLRTCYDINPRTGIKFTDAELDAIEGGVKLTV